MSNNFQGHLSIFQGSRTQRDFKAKLSAILEIQGRLATLVGTPKRVGLSLVEGPLKRVGPRLGFLGCLPTALHQHNHYSQLTANQNSLSGLQIKT